MKICSTSLAMRETQNVTTLRYHYVCQNSKKKAQNTDEDTERWAHLYTDADSENVKGHSHSREEKNWQFFQS